MSDTPPIPVFDLGGVFVDWNPMYLFRKLFKTEEEAQWFRDNIYSNGFNLELAAGDSYAEAVVRLSARFPKYWREIQAYDVRWKETVGDNLVTPDVTGDKIRIEGVILDGDGNPINDAMIEINSRGRRFL